MARVTFFHADGCSLCRLARETLLAVRAETPFDLEEIDIAGNDELEAGYREWLPVVEIDGERAFVYYVDEGALRRRLHKAASG